MEQAEEMNVLEVGTNLARIKGEQNVGIKNKKR